MNNLYEITIPRLAKQKTVSYPAIVTLYLLAILLPGWLKDRVDLNKYPIIYSNDKYSLKNMLLTWCSLVLVVLNTINNKFEN